MLVKVVTLAALIFTVIETRPQGFHHGHGHLHGHGHAYSSQSIMMHPQNEEPIYYHHSKPYPNKERDHIHRVPVKTQRHRPNQIHEVPVRRPSGPYDRPGVPFDLNDARPHGMPFGINDARPQHGKPFGINNGKAFGINDGKAFGINDIRPNGKPHHGPHITAPFEVNDERPDHGMPFSHHQMPVMDEHQNKKVNHHLFSNSVPPHREYEFNYNIADIDTGDHKTHHETRNDGVVKGVYSFQEADGSIRIVEYTADEHNGFHANVRYEGLKHKVPKHRPHNHHAHHHQNNRQNFHPLLFNESY